MRQVKYDAVVVGAGPNGLAAAIALAQSGLSTLVIEAKPIAGGGMRSGPLTLPGVVHDLCSAVHPLGISSPFFRTLELERHGLSWVQSPAALVHALEEGSYVTLERSIEATADQLGRDGAAYRALMAPIVAEFDALLPMILGPLRMPSRPWLLARFGLKALQSMRGLAERNFVGERAGALLAGIAAHAMLPLDAAATASFALVLASAGHAVGWPIARGGSQAIANALISFYTSQGGELALKQHVSHLDQLPAAHAYVLDVTPKQLLSMTTGRLPEGYRRRLRRFRYGPGVYKMDWALRGPIPWRDPICARATTVHLSGDLRQIHAAEAAVHAGKLATRPFVLLGQPSLFDETRAPAGIHTVWAYCHVPHGESTDASQAIEAHIEHFAPGFGERVLARSMRNAIGMEQHNPNYVGGDINGGLSDLGQLFFRPVFRLDPYSTPAPNIFVCSSSTPPGGGVHGMCGYWAARSVLARVFNRHESGSLSRTSSRAPAQDAGEPNALGS